MANGEIQIVSNEKGEPTAVLVPIELWRDRVRTGDRLPA